MTKPVTITTHAKTGKILEEDDGYSKSFKEQAIHIKVTEQSEIARSGFGLLPDEILLIIFKMLPCSWRELLTLRQVCKQWDTLLRDTSLKYGKLSEDLTIMMNNEKKHYSRMRNYLESGCLKENISLEMRSILVDWLVEVVEEFKLESETLFLTIHYIDRYLSEISLSDKPITKGKLQLLGITSLLIASKYEEICVPTVADLVYIADNTYKKEEVLTMEVNLLNVLRFDITICTMKRFVQYFLKTAEGGLPKSQEAVVQRSTLENLSNYISELALVDYRFATQHPSLVGASIVCLALHVEGLTWTYILESETHYSLDDLTECVQGLWKLFIEAPKACLQAVYHKFAQSKYDSVSSKPMVNSLPFNNNKASINYI